MTDVDKKLLTRIYQDARVGTLGSEEVLEKCTDEKLKMELLEKASEISKKIIEKTTLLNKVG